MIVEIAGQIEKPGAIFCSVGGGGLLGGVIKGCAKAGWDDGELNVYLSQILYISKAIS